MGHWLSAYVSFLQRLSAPSFLPHRQLQRLVCATHVQLQNPPHQCCQRQDPAPDKVQHHQQELPDEDLVASEEEAPAGALSTPIPLRRREHDLSTWSLVQIVGDVLRQGQPPDRAEMIEGRSGAQEAREARDDGVVIQRGVADIHGNPILEQPKLVKPSLVSSGTNHHVAGNDLATFKDHALLAETVDLSHLGVNSLNEVNLTLVQHALVKAPPVKVAGKCALGHGHCQEADQPKAEESQLVRDQEQQVQEHCHEASESRKQGPAMKGRLHFQEPVGRPEKPGHVLVALLLEGADHVTARLPAAQDQHPLLLCQDLLHDRVFEGAAVDDLALKPMIRDIRHSRLGR
mmetsp:Transcript_125143/g.296923  ORF Transcript_125143/g.296923 Transcript_125143/m.296923 type:complete len:346 (-) Transcript_125143:502-1539(-)